MVPTEGEWKCYWQQSGDEADCGVYADRREGMAYSVCRCPRYQTKEQWKEDGPVLACAKEFMRACEALPLEFMKGELDAADFVDHARYFMRAMELANKAFQKLNAERNSL